MPFDRAIAKSIWDGKLPCVFALSQTDLASFKQPDPIYLIVPRCSFFPLVLDDRLKQHFQEFASKGGENDEMWLEYNGTPLKWHYPIGVLFDLYATGSPLPWSIQVHFRNFPADKLVRLNGEDAVQTHFFSMIKQTDYLKNGSTKKVMNLSKNDQLQLWESLRTNQFDKFWAVNTQLISDANANPYKAVPLRIYVSNGSVIQDLIPPLTIIGRPTLLLDALRRCLPQLFPSPPGAAVFSMSTTKRTVIDAEEEGTAATNEGAGDPTSTESTTTTEPSSAAPMTPEAPTGDAGSLLTVTQEGPPTEVIIHGVRPSLETPLLWLSDNFSHPDNFLYVIVQIIERPRRR